MYTQLIVEFAEPVKDWHRTLLIDFTREMFPELELNQEFLVGDTLYMVFHGFEPHQLVEAVEDVILFKDIDLHDVRVVNGLYLKDLEEL